MSDKEECWSATNEEFNYSSLGELIANEADVLDVGRIVYVGDAEKPTMRQLCNAYDVIEIISERAYDIGGEYADDFPNVDKAAKDELDELLVAWLTKHCPNINFYTVSNVREYVITADDLETT